MIDDIFLYVIGLFAIVFVMGMFILAFSGFNTFAQNSDAPDNIKGISQNLDDNWPSSLDYTFLALYIVFLIGALVLTWTLPTNPLFFGVFIFIILIVGIVAGYLANIFYDFSQEGILSSTFSQMPIVTHILTNYILYAIMPVILMVVVFFAKPNGGGLY